MSEQAAAEAAPVEATAPAEAAPAEQATQGEQAPAAEPTPAEMMAAAEAALSPQGEQAPGEQAPPGEQSPEGTPPKEGERRTIPEPQKLKPQSARERLLAKAAKQQAAADAQPLQAKLDAMQRELGETKAQFEARQAGAQKALDEGRFDDALKDVLGVDFAALQRRVLEHKGKFAPVDPAVQEKLDRLEQLEQERAAQAEEYQRQLAQREHQQQLAQLDTEIVEEMKTSDVQGLDALATIPGFVLGVREQLVADPDLTTEQAAGNLLPAFRTWFEAIAPAAQQFGWFAGASQPSHPSGSQPQPARRAPTHLSQQASAVPKGPPVSHDSMSEEESKEAAIQKALNALP